MARRRKRMTSREFFKVLKRIRATWKINDEFMGYGHIRCYVDELQCCPITRVYKEKFGARIHTNGWEVVACELGLDPRFARRLVHAADNTGHYRLRQKLLRATGLA